MGGARWPARWPGHVAGHLGIAAQVLVRQELPASARGKVPATRALSGRKVGDGARNQRDRPIGIVASRICYFAAPWGQDSDLVRPIASRCSGSRHTSGSGATAEVWGLPLLRLAARYWWDKVGIMTPRGQPAHGASGSNSAPADLLEGRLQCLDPESVRE